MALPLTITGISTTVACAGPYRATNGAYYFFGVDGTTATTLQAYKSTAPDTSWSSIATKTGFTTAINWIACHQVGNIFHLIITDGTVAGDVSNRKYQTFDASSDTFVTAETIASGEDNRVSGNSAGPYADIVVRTSGEILVIYNGARSGASGQIFYKRRTAVNTWSAGVLVGPSGDHLRGKIGIGSSGRLHFMFQTSTQVNQKHLTSANVLGISQTSMTGSTNSDIVGRDDAGTFRMVAVATSVGCKFDSANDPTVTQVTGGFGAPARIAEDNGTFWVVYRDNTTSDIFVKSSTDDGGSWGTATTSLTGTVAAVEQNMSRDMLAYVRGANVVFPYLVNDNGTLKYNEFNLRAAPPEGALAATEAADTASFTGTVRWNAALAATEAKDTASFTGTVRWNAALAATEAADTAAFTGSVAWAAVLAATEAADTASFTGNVSWTAVLAASEAPDTAAFTGEVSWLAVLAASEAADTASFVGAVTDVSGDVTGTMTAIETADGAAFAGDVTGNAGVLIASEAADTAAFAGAVQWTGVLAASEAPDTAAFVGVAQYTGTLVASEAPDTAAFTGGIFSSGVLAVTEAPDTASFTGLVRQVAVLAATEAADTASFAGTVTFVPVTGVLNASEDPDVCSIETDLALPIEVQPGEMQWGRVVVLSRW